MTGAALLVVALQQAALTGVVRDSVDLEPVAFARVTATSLGGKEVAVFGSTDRFGAFVVPGVSATGRVRVEVSALGYGMWTRVYEALPSSGPVRVLLKPAPIGLEGLEVAVTGRAGDRASLSRGAFVVDSALLGTLPAILETDVLRAIAVSPSASTSSDYTSVPFVRGGSSDGTPVLLDGVRLFNAVHLGGFISAVSPEIVKRATLLAGSGGDGFTVGSLSGAIDIVTRDGSRDRRQVTGSLGLGSSRFSVEGPVGESASYLLSARRSYIDGFTLALERMGAIEEHLPYFFQDLHAKATIDLGGIRRISVTGYLNSESLTEVDALRGRTVEMDMAWGTAAFAVHYRAVLGATGILDANLGHSRFRSDLARIREEHFNSTGHVRARLDTTLFGDGLMSETRAGLRATWHKERATITAGTQATVSLGDHDYHVADRYYSDNDVRPFALLDVREERRRLAGYVSAEVPLRRGFSTRAGLRVDRFQGLATDLAGFGELSYAGSWWDAYVSASRSHQALTSLRNEEALLASFLAYDLLIPVSEAPVPRNTEFLIGWEGSRGGLLVRLDAYARALANLRLPELESNPIRDPALGDPSFWVMASGAARGIEASWSWTVDRGVSVLGSYRWAGVSRTVGSRTYTPRFHRAHELELGSSWRRGGSSWSTRVSLRSGQPFTPLLGIVPFEPYPGGVEERVNRVLLGGGYNSARLPHYARIDIAWRRGSEVSWFGGGSLEWYVSVANLFNLPNVVGWLVEETDRGKREVHRRQLPMTPFFGVELRF